MATTWPLFCRLVVNKLSVAVACVVLVLYLVRCVSGSTLSDGSGTEDEGRAGGGDMTQTTHSVRKEGRVDMNHQVFQNSSYHLNQSKSTLTRRRKSRRQKGLKEKLLANGTQIRRKKKKRKNLIVESSMATVDQLENGVTEIQKVRFLPTSPTFPVPVKSEPVLEKSAIIRTSEDDHPGKRLLIETFRTDSKSEVRYYPNYLVQHNRAPGSTRSTPLRHGGGRRPGYRHRNPQGVPGTQGYKSRNNRINIPRYDSHYSNWMGLRYGCDCDVQGSEHAQCDIVTGQCACRENVTGRACAKCKAHHWGLPSGQGCRPCNCNSEGSLSGSCGEATGQCPCKPGVTGLQCDTCQAGHYGFSSSGCARCQECSLQGHICDQQTGRCVCPPYSQGSHCQSCVPNSWGYKKLEGCTPCDCDSGGSHKPQCDFQTGKCPCRKGFRGVRCDACEVGFFGFPFCKSCECNSPGTMEDACDAKTGRCRCDERGVCPCKSNVLGVKCDTCRNGTFGIQPDNPNGCTACFCFGRSASCTQAGLQWGQIRSSRTRAVSIEYDPSPPFKNTLPIDTQEICYVNLAIPGGGEVTLNGADRGLNVTNNLRTIPGDSEDVKIGVSFLFDTPVYWQLPDQFLGDKILSYGGFLRFTVETEGGHTQLPAGVLGTYPLVQLQGNSKIILEHFPLFPSPKGRYEVRFHESLWREKHPNRKVSRETLMIALQNIQHILIRASDAVDFTKVTLRDVSMDTAAVSNGITTAGGVELCECPPEYNSTSCQDPSIGFYRWYNKNVNSATILIQLVGEAKPCECNDRSQVCDIETGYCLNCKHNTGGPHCERCGEGYYGDPTRGPCLPCPCPTDDRNFASTCQVVPGRETVCICKEGYTGKFCDRCAYGWFGYPETEGGSCQPCECDPYGSVSDECHEKTGQCNCRPGIEGTDCSICPRRRVLTPKGCSTCEDGCTGTLLSDLDNLTALLDEELRGTGPEVAPPWKRLLRLEQRSQELGAELVEWQETASEVENLIEHDVVLDVALKTKELLNASSALEITCINKQIEASLMANEARSALEEIAAARRSIASVIETLGNYTSGAGGAVSDSAALMEARRLLDKMAGREFEPRRQRAEESLDLCTGVLNKTLSLGWNEGDVREVRERLAELVYKMEELEVLVRRTVDTSAKKSFQTSENRNRVKHLTGKINQARTVMGEVETAHTEAEDLLDEADYHLAQARSHLANMTDVKAGLRNRSLQLEQEEGILYRLNAQYRTEYVRPAQEHAERLMRKAKEYRDLFNMTRQDASTALAASKAYQDIVDALESVREAAEGANVSADISYKEVFPTENQDSLSDKSTISKSVSSRLASRGNSTAAKGDSLRDELGRRKAAVERLGETVRRTGEADNDVSEQLQRLEDLKVDEKVQNAIDRVKNLESSLGEAKESVQKISNDVINKLKPQLAKLASEAKHLNLQKARENIEESLVTNQRAVELLNKLKEDYDLRQQRQTFRAENQTLSNVLINLKNKITEARHAAQNIHLSLSSNSTLGCVRSFKVPTLEPSTTTKLVLTLTVNPDLRNGILFYLPSSSSSDYIAVELVDGIVRFLWNNGGGPGVVWKALNEDPRSSRSEGPRWYKIVVERTGYTARLWVLPGGFPTSNIPPRANSSDPRYGRLDVGPQDRVWIGGVPPGQERLPEFLSLQQGLIGCLHSVTLDERPLGLWSFYSDSSDSCSACEKSGEEAVDDSSYNFNGEGYAVLKHVSKSTYNKYQFSMALKFKTYDDNAILFLAINVEKDRYVSLTLRDGRVVFQIGYGPDSQLEMSTSKKYNDGNWTVLEASRSFDRRRGIEKGLLKVGDEMKEAAPPTPPMQSQIPELSGADYLVGGTPQGYNFGSLHLRLPKSLLGCMADLFIDKELYNPLRGGRSNGVDSACSEKSIKVAGFRGEGYLKLEASNLNKKAAFGLALRTLQADALILLANGRYVHSGPELDTEEETPNEINTLPEASQRKDSYYSISLVDGRAEVRIDAGKGAVTLVSQTLLNDGRFHSISVTKSGKHLELRVDDEFQAASELPEGRPKVRVKDLYLGGTPQGVEASSYVSDFTPFVGTIKDVLFNYVLQKFDHPLSFSGVDLGRLGPERGENSVVSTFVRVTPPPHTGCHRSRIYVLDPKAVKFGDSPHSHVQVNVRRRGVFNKNYTVEVDFRTFYPNGLVFLIPGATRRNKQKHYVVMTLRNGQLQIIVKAKRKVELSSTVRYNDGTWHHVMIARNEKNFTLVIDSGEVLHFSKFPKKVNLGSAMYVGGLPENLLAPDNLLARLEGFKGCMRNLAVSNQTEALIGEKSLHQRVGQCFPQIERGSYFSGDAYVVHRGNFVVESLLQIELEFRTSETNGILLSISDSPGYPAFSLEIHNGKILLSGDIGDRRQFQLMHEFASQFAVCDSKWHRIHVMYERNEVTLRVDQVDRKLSLPRIGHFMKASVNAPLYIGGLSEHVSGGKPILETRDNFKGCMRSLVISGERVDWTQMSSVHNLLIGSCPAATQH